MTVKLLMVSTNCFAQTDLTKIRSQIDSVVKSIAGKDNFDKHVVFNEWRSTCDLWSGSKYEGSSTFKNKEVSFVPNQYNLWYDLDIAMDNYLDDRILVSVDIDSGFTRILISGLPRCFTDTTTCNSYITSDEAVNIARKSGLAKGLSDWETSFGWEKTGVEYLINDSIKIVLDQGYYRWSVTNILSIRTPEPCLNGAGENLEIDALTGAIIKKQNRIIACVH